VESCIPCTFVVSLLQLCIIFSNWLLVFQQFSFVSIVSYCHLYFTPLNQKNNKLQKTQQHFLTHVSCTSQPNFPNSTQHAVVILAISGSSTSHMVTSTLTSFSISNNLYCVHSLAGNSGLHNTWPSQRTEIQLCVSTFIAHSHTAELWLPLLKVMQWCGVYCLLSFTVLTGSHVFFCKSRSPVFSILGISRCSHCLEKMNVYSFPRKQYILNSNFNQKCCYIAWNGQLTIFWISDLKMYTVSYVETRKHHMLSINKVFCTWRPTCWWDVFCSALTDGVDTKGAAATHMFEVWEKSWY
jgi:hypothetical protein